MATPHAQVVALPRKAASALPHYELRAKRQRGSDMALEIWQLPASATPHIKQPTYVAGLHGRNLSLVEHRLLRRLKVVRINLNDLPAIDALRVPIDEELQYAARQRLARDAVGDRPRSIDFSSIGHRLRVRLFSGPTLSGRPSAAVGG